MLPHCYTTISHFSDRWIYAISFRMSRLVLLLGAFFLLPSVSTPLDISQKKTIMRRMGQCMGCGGLPILFHSVVIARDTKTGNMSVSCKVTVRREVSEKFAIVINIWRCDPTGNPDTCEIFLKNYNATTVCRLLSAKNQLWSAFFEHFDMDAKCPIKPNVYTLDKLPINTYFMKFMPMPDGLWRTRMTAWDAGTYVSCVDFDIQIFSSSKDYRNTKRRF